MSDGPADIIFWAVITASWVLALAATWEGRNEDGHPLLALVCIAGFVALSVLAVFIAGDSAF